MKGMRRKIEIAYRAQNSEHNNTYDDNNQMEIQRAQKGKSNTTTRAKH